MLISSEELRHADFPRSLYGYDPVVVRRFLSELADAVAVLSERSARLATIEEEWADRAAEIERTKKRADEELLSAHAAAREMLDQAQRDSESAVRSARLQAIDLTSHARAERDRLNREVQALQVAYDELAASYRVLLSRALGALVEVDQAEPSRKSRDAMRIVASAAAERAAPVLSVVPSRQRSS